jgi:hypothetical protein
MTYEFTIERLFDAPRGLTVEKALSSRVGTWRVVRVFSGPAEISGSAPVVGEG